MSLELNVRAVTLPAAADLSASQHRIVTIDANGAASLATATSLGIGVLQNKPVAAQAASVAYSGVTKVVAGGTIAAGARVTSDANAAAIAATTGGDSVIGLALASAVAGDKVAVLLGQYPFVTLA
jgi:hypothetical protein